MPWKKHGFWIGLIGLTLEKPIVFSFTIKTAVDYVFIKRLTSF